MYNSEKLLNTFLEKESLRCFNGITKASNTSDRVDSCKDNVYPSFKATIAKLVNA